MFSHGQLSLFIGSSAFTGPMSRRDAFKTLGAGLGAAAAVSSVGPASAAFTTIEQNYQDRLNIIREQKNVLEDGKLPYEKLMASASKPAGVEKVETASGYYYSNGKSENGVSFRKPNDPNACSDVSCITCEIRRHI